MTDLEIANKEYGMLKHVIEYKSNEAWASLNDAKDNLEYVQSIKDDEKIAAWTRLYENACARWGAYNDILKAVDLIKG